MKRKIAEKFQTLFLSEGEFFASAGRINLIGEHTDYNGGFVFPGAIDKGMIAEISLNGTNKVCAYALDLDEYSEFGLNEEDVPAQGWAKYIFGVCREIIKRGGNIAGFNTVFSGDVPLGAGMSSSAALESTYAYALNELFNLGIDKFELARIGQSTEHNYVGVKCGIMDQFASAMGKAEHAIFLDCKKTDFKLVPLKMDGCKLVITNTNKKHSLASSKYNERRGECEKGFELLKEALPSITCLGDVTVEMFEKAKHLIKDEIVLKRVTHVINEDDRVLRSIDALTSGDIALFGQLMNESHDSLRDLYEVTGIELDTLVEEARKIPGVIGSRMTGAGFGGSTVSIVKEESVEQFKAQVSVNYTEKIGYEPTIHVCDIGDGGRELK